MNNLYNLIGYVEIPKNIFLNISGNRFFVNLKERALCVREIKNSQNQFSLKTNVESIYNISDEFYKNFLVEVLSYENILYQKTFTPVCFFKESSINKESGDVSHDVPESFIPLCRENVLKDALKEVMLRIIIHFLYNKLLTPFLTQDFDKIHKELENTEFRDLAISKLKSYGTNPTQENFRDFATPDYSFLKIFKNHNVLRSKISSAESYLLEGDFSQGVTMSKEIHQEIINQIKILFQKD